MAKTLNGCDALFDRRSFLLGCSTLAAASGLGRQSPRRGARTWKEAMNQFAILYEDRFTAPKA